MRGAMRALLLQRAIMKRHMPNIFIERNLRAHDVERCALRRDARRHARRA